MENSGKGLPVIQKICLSFKGLKVLPAPGQRERAASSVSMMGLREVSAVLLMFPLTLTSSPLLSAGEFRKQYLMVTLLLAAE